MAGLFGKFKETVFSLIVWAIVAAGGLLYFNVGHKPPSTPPGTPGTPPSTTPPTLPSTSPSPPTTNIDFPGYFATFDQLAGRSSEQDEFVKNMKGKKVRWRGYVWYVRNSDVARTKIALAITPTPSDQLRLALVYFGEDMRARLFALREKDSVEITGRFDSDAEHTPYIQGDTMQPLPAGLTTPPTSAIAVR